MGGWNPVADIGKAVENIGNEASKAVNTVGQVVSNAGNLVGGDVGKVINAATNPVGATIQAGGSLIGGDVKGAVARSTGAMLAAGSAPIAASSTVADLAKNDLVNGFTFGMSNDISEANMASRRMISTGEIKDNDWSAMGRLGVRTGILLGTAGAAVAYGPAIEAGVTAMAPTVTAAGAAAGAAGSTAAGTAATAVVGNEIKKYLNGNQTQTEAPVVATASKTSFLPLVLVAGVGTLFLFLLKRKK